MLMPIRKKKLVTFYYIKALLLLNHPVDIMNIKSPVSHKHGRLLAGTGSVLHLTMKSMYVKLHRS